MSQVTMAHLHCVCVCERFQLLHFSLFHKENVNICITSVAAGWRRAARLKPCVCIAFSYFVFALSQFFIIGHKFVGAYVGLCKFIKFCVKLKWKGA